MRSDRKADASLCVMLCSCLLAAAGGLAADGDLVAAHTAELIRLHHESIALLGPMPPVQKSESHTCEQPGNAAKYDAKKFPSRPAPDA